MGPRSGGRTPAGPRPGGRTPAGHSAGRPNANQLSPDTSQNRRVAALAVGAARRRWHQARSCRFPAVPDRIERAGKVRARASSNWAIGAADLAPITLLDSGCRVLIGVRCPSGDRTRSTKPRKVAKLSARAGILRVKCLISGTGPGRPSRGPEAYDPRTAENITNRDTSCAGPRNRPPDRPRD